MGISCIGESVGKLTRCGYLGEAEAPSRYLCSGQHSEYLFRFTCTSATLGDKDSLEVL